LTSDDFRNPPDTYKPRPFWELSGTLNKAATEEQLTNAKFSSEYSGVVWLPILSTKPAYLSEDYFTRFHEMLDKADQLGMKVTLYDECDFPTDLSNKVSGGSVTWSVPVGSWKIMIFTCVNGWSGVDYLEPNSVNKFISLTHQNYYDRFPDHFGKTIDMTFLVFIFWLLPGKME